MCKAIEDMCDEALERGRKEGRIATGIEVVRNLKKNLGLSEQQVKEILEISEEDWKCIAGQI